MVRIKVCVNFAGIIDNGIRDAIEREIGPVSETGGESDMMLSHGLKDRDAFDR